MRQVGRVARVEWLALAGRRMKRRRKPSTEDLGDLLIHFARVMIANMSTATKYRYIVSTPGVRGGHACVEGTRIGVHDVVAYHLLGCSMEETCSRFPDVTRAQIYECLAYYEDHRAEIESLALAQTQAPAE